MKKIIMLFMGVFFTVLIMFSCASWGGLYDEPLSVSTDTFETVEGKTTVETLKIRSAYDDWGDTNYTLRFKKFTTPKGEFYTVNIYFFFTTWRFYDTIDIKIDDKIYQFKDEEPNRNVLGGGNVSEELSIIFTQEGLTDEIINCSSLTIGVSTNLFVITEEELKAIKAFLSI